MFYIHDLNISENHEIEEEIKVKQELEYIKGFTFRLCPGKAQGFADEKTKESLRTLKASTAIDTAVIAIVALQDTPHSEQIDYTGSHMPSDDELKEMIAYAKSLGLRVILKPMVNCRNGVWRAFINFFDKDVVCEPKWSQWFKNYEAYMLHYAKIAQETGCEMLIVGCELVMSERQEKYWRDLIGKVRGVYSGLLTYNTDKYQEDQVQWWDALDVISSSGYYPIDRWEENYERIYRVVQKFGKPFFFAECGIPCRTGSAQIPNDWTFQGPFDLEEQRRYYEKMFEESKKHPWMRGFVCWDWMSNYTEYPIINDGYSVYGKPACEVIKSFYQLKERE